MGCGFDSQLGHFFAFFWETRRVPGINTAARGKKQLWHELLGDMVQAFIALYAYTYPHCRTVFSEHFSQIIFSGVQHACMMVRTAAAADTYIHYVHMLDGEEHALEVPLSSSVRTVLSARIGVDAAHIRLYDTERANTSLCIVQQKFVIGERLYCPNGGLAIVMAVRAQQILVQQHVLHQRNLRHRITPAISQCWVGYRLATAWRENYDALHLEDGIMVHQDYSNADNRVYLISACRHSSRYRVATLGVLRADPSAAGNEICSRNLLMHNVIGKSDEELANEGLRESHEKMRRAALVQEELEALRLQAQHERHQAERAEHERQQAIEQQQLLVDRQQGNPNVWHSKGAYD
jgi:hypothetical protein